MTDKELEQLLLDASVTRAEIERCRPAFPEVKVFVECLFSHVAGMVAQKAIDEWLRKEGIINSGLQAFDSNSSKK